jgi:hypothetical protein
MTIMWMAGIVYAKGWLIFIACIFPPYAWYLVVEHVMRAMNLI